jgi:hypothetical protein
VDLGLTGSLTLTVFIWMMRCASCKGVQCMPKTHTKAYRRIEPVAKTAAKTARSGMLYSLESAPFQSMILASFQGFLKSSN